jgi:hypothetical protein
VQLACTRSNSWMKSTINAKDGCVPKALIAESDINGCYLEAVIRI